MANYCLSLIMFRIEKIISGGQTGVDRGALEASLKQGFHTGGWCPPNRATEDDRIPDYLPLEETPDERSNNAPNVPRSLRTEWNVRDSDATLILIPKLEQKTDLGTEWTKTCCINMNKPFLICDPSDVDSLSKVMKWSEVVKPKVLNVAGPSEHTVPGIQKATKKMITELLSLKLTRTNE